ncbi:MAG: hypothetical protein C4289_03410, partial [Chloroflexota bacterium]
PDEREEMQATVRLSHVEGYQFDVAPDTPADWRIRMDEPAPLGAGAGPNAARMLAAAVGHCLSASLLFCMHRARGPVSGITTTVTATMRRNERGRWRVAGLHVDLELPPLDETQQRAWERCKDLFEDYCIVTASVRQGIPVDVTVSAATEGGRRAGGS